VAALIYTANTVAWALTILLALVATVTKRDSWAFNFMAAMASSSIWGTVLIHLGAPVWPYIAYALLVFIFVVEAFFFVVFLVMRKRETKEAKREGIVHIKKEPQRSA
jgi:apolipoprotein N-acyltransferase